MKHFIRIMANDIANEKFTKAGCVTFGIVVSTALVAALMLAGLIS